MLDENLPTFFIKPSSDNERQSNIFFGQGGHDLQPEYSLRRPDPTAPESRDCYALALYDSYNPEVLFAEVVVRLELTTPSLSQGEIRANNGVSPPPVPFVPNSFIIQLYNPDQQVIIRQVNGTWNTSAHWEFEMPQQTFRQPSVSALDRSQDDPAVAPTTPKISFKWKRDSKLSKDITCLLVGKSTDGKRNKEPDITIAMFRQSKELTVYQSNMQRVEVEDSKGLEVVLLLSATVIREVFFNPSRELFNIGVPIANGRTNSFLPAASGALQPTVQANGFVPVFQQSPPKPRNTPSPNSQAAIDAETSRLLALVREEEEERERQERNEEKRTKKMLEEEERRTKKMLEEKERRTKKMLEEEERRIKKMLEEEAKEMRRQEEEVAKETERLRRQYGVDPVPDSPGKQVHFSPRPQFSNLPIRPHPHSIPPNNTIETQPLSSHYSVPNSGPAPVQRPQSAGPTPRPDGSGSSGFPILSSWWSTGQRGRSASGQPPNVGLNATASGFSGTHTEYPPGMPEPGKGKRNKVQKKESV